MLLSEQFLFSLFSMCVFWQHLINFSSRTRIQISPHWGYQFWHQLRCLWFKHWNCELSSTRKAPYDVSTRMCPFKRKGRNSAGPQRWLRLATVQQVSCYPVNFPLCIFPSLRSLLLHSHGRTWVTHSISSGSVLCRVSLLPLSHSSEPLESGCACEVRWHRLEPVMHTDSGARLSGPNPPSPELAPWLWAGDLTFLSFTFLICKIRFLFDRSTL